MNSLILAENASVKGKDEFKIIVREGSLKNIKNDNGNHVGREEI